MVTMSRGLPPFGVEGFAGAMPVVRRAPNRARAAWRALLILLWTILAALVQVVLIKLPGRGKITFARVYWAVVCRCLGVRIRVIGTPAREPGRAIVYASNHSSWLDVAVLGGTLEACFIAKAEVAEWPVIRIVARLGRTVFVSRRASETGRERDSMRERLQAGDGLILFPEGTSSDGSRVLPFRSAFFSVAEVPGGAGPLLQPVSIVYDRLDGLPMGRASRPACAWYGAMELGTHFLQLARFRGVRATVLLHPTIEPAVYASRKALAQTAWQNVADGAAALRQNRPVSAFA